MAARAKYPVLRARLADVCWLLDRKRAQLAAPRGKPHEYEFGQGDSLVIDLVAEQELNDFVHAYETKNYHVVKVHSHTRGSKQPSML